jgi:hypothetical protein
VSKPEIQRFRLSEFTERKREQGSIEIETDDGSVFRVDPPELWPDDIASATNNEAAARLIMGGDPFDAFVAAGGSATLLVSIIAEAHGVSLGELLASAGS